MLRFVALVASSARHSACCACTGLRTKVLRIGYFMQTRFAHHRFVR